MSLMLSRSRQNTTILFRVSRRLQEHHNYQRQQQRFLNCIESNNSFSRSISNSQNVITLTPPSSVAIRNSRCLPLITQNFENETIRSYSVSTSQNKTSNHDNTPKQKKKNKHFSFQQLMTQPTTTVPANQDFSDGSNNNTNDIRTTWGLNKKLSHTISSTGKVADAHKLLLDVENRYLASLRSSSSTASQSSFRPENDDDDDSIIVVPNLMCYDTVLNGYIRHEPASAATMGEDILMHTIKMSRLYPEYNIHPDNIMYSKVINAFVKLKHGLPKALDLLERMHRHGEEAKKGGRTTMTKDRGGGCEPNVITYTTVLDGYSRRGRAEEAEILLDRMWQLAREGKDCKPNDKSYTTVIAAWSRKKNGRRRAALSAEKLLEEMNRLYRTGEKSVKPSRHAFTAVVHAWARAAGDGDGDGNGGESSSPPATAAAAAERAESILRHMIELSRDDGVYGDIAPHAETYNAAMNAWALLGDGARAEGVFDLMVRERVVPNHKTYTTLLNAWAKKDGKGDMDKVDEVYERMKRDYEGGNKSVRPDGRFYSALSQIYISHGDAARAGVIIDKMARDYDNGIKAAVPQAHLYADLISAMARANKPYAAEEYFQNMVRAYEMSGNERCRPNTVCYNALINAWARVGEVKKAENVYAAMTTDYNNGNVSARPNVITLSTVIRAWSNSKHRHAASRAHAMLVDMETTYEDTGRMKPNNIVYSTVMEAHARRGTKESAALAFDLLQKLKSRYAATGNDVDFKPNVWCYTKVMMAYESSRQPQRVLDVFDELRRVYDDTGDKDYYPGCFTYACAISAWSVSSLDDDAVPPPDVRIAKANDVYGRLMTAYAQDGNEEVRPDNIALGALLHTCAVAASDLTSSSTATTTAAKDTARTKVKTLEIALRALKHANELRLSLNHTAYEHLFRVVSLCMLNDRNRSKVVKMLWTYCTRTGNVGPVVLTYVKDLTSRDEFRALAGGRDVEDMVDLPTEWTRRVTS